jgi:hypothetical protein
MKFKLDALVHLHLCGNSDKKKKKSYHCVVRI